MPETIKGKVAQIINERTLVINVGSAHGVAVGMIFEILNPRGQDIQDPETGENLGSIPIVKIEVKVKRVFEKMSECTTFKTHKINIGGESYNFGSLTKQFLPSEWITFTESLKISSSSTSDLDEDDSLVKIGDPAVQKIDEEDS